MKTIVLFRANPDLTARVRQKMADFAFIKEFPAQMSVNEIAEILPAVLKEARKSLNHGEFVYRALVDGTVMLAAGKTLEYGRTHLIRQDNAGAYDWYAAHIAETAKTAARVILVRANIADHNTEGFSSKEESDHFDRLRNDPKYRPSREEAVVQKWIERLQRHGITPEVVHRFYAFDGTVSPDVGPLQGAVVICDHHHGHLQHKLEEFGGNAYFNAFPPCKGECDL